MRKFDGYVFSCMYEPISQLLKLSIRAIKSTFALCVDSGDNFFINNYLHNMITWYMICLAPPENWNPLKFFNIFFVGIKT